MKKLIPIVAIAVLLLVLVGCSNTPKELTAEQRAQLNQLIHTADSLYSIGADEHAGMAYAEVLNSGSLEARYAVRAAKCFALSDSPDLAFRYLMLASKLGYHEPETLQETAAFDDLKNSAQWQILVKAIEKNQQEHLATLNREVYDIMQGDQADRQQDFTKLSQEELAGIAERDSIRLARINQIVAEDGLKVAEDYFNAALVFQHGGDSTAYQMAHKLSLKAFELDSTLAHAAWLSAASWDRYLQSVGKPQVYGTQYWYNTDKDGNLTVTMEPYDTTAVTDAERAHLQVPSLAEQRAQLKLMQQQ